jgi:GT2 family glycosyltransferase
MPVCVGETRHSGTSSQWLPRCSVIIPVHNRTSLTRQCLNTLLEGHPESVNFEIIVVDDASTDSTQQLLTDYREQVRVVTHARNTGFAAACNDGVAAASGEYLVFLNNDAIPNAGWLDALVRYAESHPDAAVVGSKLLFPNDTIQHAGVVLCQDLYPRHLYAGFPSDHPAVNKSRRFQVVTAACMLVRREPFEQVGGFDTAFRNGLEDVDLCLRLGERGSEVHYCHESVLYHLESLSGGWSENKKENARLYRSRWAHRVQPDDFHYYLEDGLLKVSYAHTWSYPIHLTVSPLLAVMDEDEHERRADQLLNVRSRQVFDLLRETIHLTLRAREAELRAVTEEQAEHRPPIREHAEKSKVTGAHPVVAQQAGYLEAPAAVIEAMPSNEAELKAMLLDAHEQLLWRDQEIESLLYNLQTVLAGKPGQRVSDAPTAASATDQGFAPSKYFAYQRLVRRIREIVRDTLPTDATVIVASKGDNELLRLDVRQAWHFPQNEDGAYAGYYPADSAAAIDHLEELRSKGGGFLLFPTTALWWLDHYDEFREHLEQRYQVLVREVDACVVFALQANLAL